MKKKFLGLLATLLLIGTTSSFAATGVGLQGGYMVGANGGGSITFKLETVDLVFAADIYPGVFGLTADYWLANPTISGTWKYFYGVGAAGSLNFANPDSLVIGLGGRALIGTNVFFLDGFLELYLQGAWQPTIWFNASKDNTGLTGDWWYNFPVNFGLRFWF